MSALPLVWSGSSESKGELSNAHRALENSEFSDGAQFGANGFKVAPGVAPTLGTATFAGKEKLDVTSLP
jgi:hypothetical protein